MSSKFLHGFGEESSELRKQIGCMTGIFQMFDRHNLLGGRSFNGIQNHKLPSGNSLVNISSNAGAHSVSCSPQLVLEKNLNKSLSENQRMSMESSRTSFSSSSCSSFSSVDCNKSTPQEPVSFNQTMKNLPNLKCSDIEAKIAHQSSDFQTAVKESRNKEPYSLSVQTSCKDEFKQPVLSYRDSPRPMQLSKSLDGSYVIGIDEKSRSPLDLNESFRVLMKLKDAPWSLSEVAEPSFEAKEAPFSRTSRDGRRFSYDGRDISSNYADSHENFRPLSKLKELPRLSLDSRESSMRSCNSIVKDLDRSSSNKERSFPLPNTRKEFESQKSAPSVVAKLMGLDSMPTSCSTLSESTDTVKSYAVEKPDFSGLQRGNKMLNNSLHSSKEDRLPKPSRTPMEPAPWKKEIHVPQNTFSRKDNQLKQKPESVYSEIEKRLKEIEFRHANKDLRALKQILDSMQAKGLLESKKNEEQHSPKPICHNSNHVVTTRSAVSRRPPLPASTKGRNTNKTYESPIVIMKPAKSINIYDVSETSVISLHGLTRLPMVRTSEAIDKKKLSGTGKLSRDSTPRTSPKINGKTEENVQRSRIRTELGASLQQCSREINGGLEKSSNSVSPRLQQRKLEVERQMSSSISSSDSSKHQKLSTNKEPTESVSPRNKLRRRPTRVHRNDDQLTESMETRNSNQQRNEISQRSDGFVSSDSKLNRDDSSTKMSSTSSEQGVQRLSASLVLKEMHSPVVPEQPSPVSVLDVTFYRDDLPISEAKKSPNQSKGINFPSSGILCDPHNTSSEINQKKLESIGNLLRKLKELHPTNEGASTTDHIASLCKTPSPDHRYISEILLASGLLMKELSSAPVGLMPIQLHPTGHPINPDLFLVLEQTKSGEISNFDTEKLHRKLLFDAVNEILIQILEGRRSNSHRKLRGNVPSGQQLLKELCSEVDRNHANPLKADVFDDDSNIIDENVLRKSVAWNDFRRGVPAIVLDIERLIFKDLIAEIVNGETAGLKHKCGRRRRQLFVK